MSSLKRIARDPLLHFLAAGTLLFVIYQAMAGPQLTASNDTVIQVDRSTLLTFLQYKSVAFQPDYFNAQFDAMPEAEKGAAVDNYVREEALYREAKAMGLSEGDYVIRRRMVEKMLYLIDVTASESFAPSEADLETYYRTHKDRYEVAPLITFTHVFVDNEIKRSGTVEEAAARLKRELEQKGAGFNDAPAYGDRFPYMQNYVDRDPTYIEHQFGYAFASDVSKLAPSDHVWYGPIKSQFGAHLILVTRHEPAHLPALAEVKEQVREDLLRDSIAANRDKAVAELVGRFKVKLDGFAAEPGASVAKVDNTASAAH